MTSPRSGGASTEGASSGTCATIPGRAAPVADALSPRGRSRSPRGWPTPPGSACAVVRRLLSDSLLTGRRGTRVHASDALRSRVEETPKGVRGRVHARAADATFPGDSIGRARSRRRRADVRNGGPNGGQCSRYEPASSRNAPSETAPEPPASTGFGSWQRTRVDRIEPKKYRRGARTSQPMPPRALVARDVVGAAGPGYSR